MFRIFHQALIAVGDELARVTFPLAVAREAVPPEDRHHILFKGNAREGLFLLGSLIFSPLFEESRADKERSNPGGKQENPQHLHLDFNLRLVRSNRSSNKTSRSSSGRRDLQAARRRSQPRKSSRL